MTEINTLSYESFLPNFGSRPTRLVQKKNFADHFSSIGTLDVSKVTEASDSNRALISEMKEVIKGIHDMNERINKKILQEYTYLHVPKSKIKKRKLIFLVPESILKRQ